ncbi:MAG: hypothetical protein KC877_03220 [Candidatus Kaiserbacteria bacterium]|nr:hypothetical protein [Candidatus Kaiserbacteria bacterium]MCB9816105.1 hypothetical protein [Candidatus Nomurabacteria bacterium]
MGIFAKLFGRKTVEEEQLPAPTEVCPVVEERIAAAEAEVAKEEERSV